MFPKGFQTTLVINALSIIGLSGFALTIEAISTFSQCSVFYPHNCTDGSYCCIPMMYAEGMRPLDPNLAVCWPKPADIREIEACGQISPNSCDEGKCQQNLTCIISEEQLKVPRAIGYCGVLGKNYTHVEQQAIQFKMAAAKISIEADKYRQLQDKQKKQNQNADNRTSSYETKTGQIAQGRNKSDSIDRNLLTFSRLSRTLVATIVALFLV